jgi:peptidoglycan glycosyltransferase
MKKKEQESSNSRRSRPLTPEEEYLRREKAKAENNKEKNRPIIVITYMMITLYMCLMAYVIYFMQFKAETVIANTRNVRQDSFAESVERGNIVTSDGEVIAYSDTDEDGNTTRHYPYARMFSHLVGYDGYGRAGLELSANFYMLRSHVNIFERVYNELAENKNRGDTVVTTVDYKLQSAAYEALGNCNGAVIAMEPSTGKILAMVSKPDYDANDLDSLWDYLQSDEGSGSTVLLNRATQGLYAPGSTFKIVTLLEYMKENPTSYNDYSYNCQGSDIFSSVTIHCYNSTAHGQETLADSLAYSCNSSFANIGTTLNYAGYRATADSLLFNTELPYDGEYNQSSFEIDADSDESELPQTVIGQGNTRITPLHNCLIVSAIANGGVLMKPYLIDRIENADGAKIKSFSAKTYGALMTSAEAANLTEYMKTVCDYGTAANIMGGASYDVAGKTGTAEYDNEGNSNSWFIGFTNPDDPDIAISVVVEDYSTYGVSATTVAKKVFDAYYN